MHSFTEKVIKQRRNELINNFDESDKKKKALLDLLLTTSIDGKGLTDLDIREEIDTFMFEVEFVENSSSNYLSNKFL